MSEQPQPQPVFSHRPDPGADPASLVYTFGGAAPVATVAPGTALEVWTEDCFAGRVRSVSDRVSQVCDPRYLNPQTGPFHIAGAEPGDTLAVHFVSVEPSRDWAVSTTVPLFGALTGTLTTATLQAPLPERTWVYDVDRVRRELTFAAQDSNHRVTMPLDPMHGTVGVAPALGEVLSALTPGAHGGNMDTPELRAGVTCYLGVNVPGAAFSLGDGHCRQGEGETCGVAVEAAMDTVVIVDVIKGVPCPWPRLESDDAVMTTGSAKPLEDAFRIAQSEMVRWVAAETGMSVLDSYQLVSQGVRSPVANVVDTAYTMVAKLPKSYLPGVDPFSGAHARLRAAAARYKAWH